MTLLTAQQAANRLGVSRRCVYYWIKSGYLLAVEVRIGRGGRRGGGMAWRIPDTAPAFKANRYRVTRKATAA